jgi:hypothetical protein
LAPGELFRQLMRLRALTLVSRVPIINATSF